MGISILELVLRRLREAGFKADVAFPGQKYPQITQTVAAVHIEKVDRDNLTVTLEVNVICPASVGGTACEVEALRATEVLKWDGASCVQHGCTYDGASQVYVVAVMATYTCVTERDDCVLGPGFEVYINGVYQPFVVAFSMEETNQHTAEFEMGEAVPTGISLGSRIWNITLEERILPGSPETREPTAPFELRLMRGDMGETYYHCRWQSVRRELTREGLRRIRTGICMLREVN